MEKKKSYENSIENVERFLNSGMHKETDRNKLIEGLSEAITEQEARNFHTTPMPIDNEEYTVEEIKTLYNIQDTEIVLRLWTLKSDIRNKRKVSTNYDELFKFLKSAMNYDDMQIWLMTKQMEGVKLTLNDKLKKFFELKSNDDILKLYDVEQNYNENNINDIRKIFNDDIEEDSDLHLGLIEEDEDDMKRYNAPKTLIKKIVPSNDDIED